MTVPTSHTDTPKKRAFASESTIGPDGEPQSNSVRFGRDGETHRFSRTTDRQKYPGLDVYPRHQEGDERVVAARPVHTTVMG